MVLRFTVLISALAVFRGCSVFADVTRLETAQHSGVITGRSVGALPTSVPGLTLAITRQPQGHLYQPHSIPAYHQDEDLQSRLRRRRRDADADATSTRAPDAAAQPQHLFPAFQPLYPLGHSRPQPLYQQEPAYSQREPLLRPQYNAFHTLDFAVGTGAGTGGGTAFRDRVYPSASLTSATGAQSGDLLGSGNFGVIHGGTFYTGEKDEIADGDSDEEDIDPDFGPASHIYGPSANGHGRPSSSGGYYRGNPEPQRYRTHEDFFSNFRDFADISTPTKSSFSEFYVVYVNRNATKDDVGDAVVAHGDVVSAGSNRDADSRPRNIMERLALLDKEASTNQTPRPVTTAPPPKKLSLGKRKLAILKKKKVVTRKTSTTDAPSADAPSADEPLLALS